MQISNSFSLENDCIKWSSSHPADAMPPRQPFAPGFLFLAQPHDVVQVPHYCLGACNGTNLRCQVCCQAGRAHAKDSTGQGDSVHTDFDRRKLMTLNNRRSVVVLPIFTSNTLLERACFELNKNVLVLKMKQGTVIWQGFKVGQSVGLATPVQECKVNVGGR